MSGSTIASNVDTHVYVGMSGGVDSSVAAALLQRQGYRVTGVYMKNWTEDLPGMKCPWVDDLADAKRVAVQLGIEFKVFDFQEQYRQRVVDYMIAEYQAGRTPNPDVMCNQEIKFKLFLQTALEDGADMIATGHYARVGAYDLLPQPLSHLPTPVPYDSLRERLGSGSVPQPSRVLPLKVTFPNLFLRKKDLGALPPASPGTKPGATPPQEEASSLAAPQASSSGRTASQSVAGDAGGRTPSSRALSERDGEVSSSGRTRDVHESENPSFSLLAGLDKNKDQSYFLYRVTEDALAHTLFPLGELTKPEVRAKAEEFGLVTASKKDSQGICFVGEVGIKEFLQQYVTAEAGDIIDKKTGKIVGQHDGAIFYTIGQRRGLGVGGGLPYYVVGKDMARNIVYVTTDLNDQNLWRHELTLDQLHWINDPPLEDQTYRVRTRYRAPLVEAAVHFVDGELRLRLHDPDRAITPGQSAVIYDDTRVVGGGIVVEAGEPVQSGANC